MDTLVAVKLFDSMNDYRLKVQMLRSVVHDYLPDEKRPFPSLANLATMLDYVQAHGLLSEGHSESKDHKFLETWKAAIDGWVERVLSWASSKVSDKCWAGTCLLGFTCEMCCSDRFQSSYSIWFERLLENFQSPSVTHIVKIACCASLGDLFTRLSCFPSLKKDGSLFAAKLIQPVLQLLNADCEDEAALNLLCTLLSFFPSAVYRHYENVEDTLALKIMAAKRNLNTSKMFANGLALLPKVKGDEDSWRLIMQKILIAINTILTDAFEGLEEEKMSSKVMKILVPPGKEPPPPLRGQALSGETSKLTMKRQNELLVPLTSLMDCLCIMLHNPYPLPVLIPVHALLATVWRVLQVDGSFHGSSRLITAQHQELLCAELPDLHLSSLDLLISIIKCLRIQLLPHGANVVRMLTEYFKRARLAPLRTKVYSVMQTLLISMGVGMTLYLAQEVISNAFADLTVYLELGSSSMHLNKQSSITVGETGQQNHRRKRKRASLMQFEYSDGVDISIETANKKPQTPLSVLIAALKALNALLTVGGSLKSERWRSDIDCLVLRVATSACEPGWVDEGKMGAKTDVSSTFADFQLAALETLLASLLSPTQGRPRYLSQGLDLFYRGRQETGTKLAAFCAHALLSLEVLIHPRSLPLVDHLSPTDSIFDEEFNQKLPSTTFNNGTKSNLPSFSNNDLALLDDEDEEPCNGWFDSNGEDTFTDRNLIDKHTETAKQSPRCSEDISNNRSAPNAEVSQVLESEKNISQNVDAEMDLLGRDEVMVDREKTEASCSTFVLSSYDASDNILDLRQNRPISAKEMAPVNSNSFLNDSLISHESEDKVKSAKLSYDSDSSSLGSLADIVDVDPDSE